MYALMDIYNNNPKLPAGNCVIKPQTCGYSSFYQFSRYTYIDTTILSSHKCSQSWEYKSLMYGLKAIYNNNP